MEPIARLEIVEAVRVCKARYFRAIDQQRWHDLAEVFTEDATIDVTDDMVFAGLDPARGITHGRDRFVANVAKMLAGVRSVHHGHMPEIEVLDGGAWRIARMRLTRLRITSTPG